VLIVLFVTRFLFLKNHWIKNIVIALEEEQVYVGFRKISALKLNWNQEQENCKY
jgi:hypothetical protein